MYPSLPPNGREGATFLLSLPPTQVYSPVNSVFLHEEREREREKERSTKKKNAKRKASEMNRNE
jgi:hypothetical protein